MTTNNKFYKDICEKLTDETIIGFHGDGYYLREICKVYGYAFRYKNCKVKYLHAMAESICGSTFTGQHTTLYYLKNIAEKLTGETYSNHTENYFLEIIKENISKPTPVPTYTDVELTATKNILSYADNDYTVFTGQLVDGSGVVERAGVVFDVSIDGVSQGTVTTNDEGKFSYRYDSRGVGDIEFTFSDRIFLIKTFSIRDAVYYSTDVISTSADVLTPLNLSGIPTNFKCSFTFKKTSYSLGWIQIGSDANNNIFFGCVGSSGQLGVYSRVNGSYEVTDIKSNVFSNNSTSTVEFECKDGVLTCSANNQTVTINISTISSRTYQAVHTKDNGAVSNILIMPL